ncbi:hypothetical protein [Ornithinimicrobium kibberense]
MVAPHTPIKGMRSRPSPMLTTRVTTLIQSTRRPPSLAIRKA